MEKQDQISKLTQEFSKQIQARIDSKMRENIATLAKKLGIKV